MAEFCIFQIRKYPFTEKFLKFTVWRGASREIISWKGGILPWKADILRKWEESVRAEAPYAYKNIDEVIAVHTTHNMAALVARMEPIFTVKA